MGYRQKPVRSFLPKPDLCNNYRSSGTVQDKVVGGIRLGATKRHLDFTAGVSFAICTDN